MASTPRPKIRPQDALEEAERDDVGQCQTCTSLALEGDVYCFHCKDYWENDFTDLMDLRENEYWSEHYG